MGIIGCPVLSFGDDNNGRFIYINPHDYKYYISAHNFGTMKSEYKILITGVVVIALFDAIGSIASRALVFNYATLGFVSFTIYAIFGFIGTRNKDLKTGVLIAAGMGLFDSIAGWEISMLLHANTGTVIVVNPSPITWIITMVFVTGIAALSGLVGGVFTKIIKARG
jgi:hypothetical protein